MISIFDVFGAKTWFSLRSLRHSISELTGPIAVRSKNLVRCGTEVSDFIIDFVTGPRPTPLPAAAVRLNSKSTKSQVLFGRLMLSPVRSDQHSSLWIRKVIDIPKTSRRLFCARPLIPKLQAGVRFYPNSWIKSDIGNAAREQGIRGATGVRPRVPGGHISVLDGKTNRGPIGRGVPENGVRFYSPLI